MALFEKIFDFDTPEAHSNVRWRYINPHGLEGLVTDGSVRGGAWNWNNTNTKSPKTGPIGPYSGSGYIYVESSSPTVKNDKFIMITEDPIDASGRNIKFSLKYSANTNGHACQLIVEVYSDGIWYKEFDQNVGSRISNWTNIDLDLKHYNNTDMLIRVTIDMLDDGTVWCKDIGIDNIAISGIDIESDEIIEFLKVRNVRKLRKNVNTFDAKHMGKIEIEAIISELKAAKPSYANYPNGVLIIETQNLVHLIKETD
jgi:hypothetical protein